jgi:hypothetical protein
VAIYTSGGRQASDVSNNRGRTVAIHIPGTEEGDHPSRYPGEAGGNPRARDGGRRSFKKVPGR